MIDPITIRQDVPERRSVLTTLRQIFNSPPCYNNVSKSEFLSGGDVSGHQGTMDWNQYFDNGMEFTIIRAMINGYVDNEFERNAEILTEQGRWFGCYGATGYPTLKNAIPYARKLADLVRGVGNLGIWWDSEADGLLNPHEMAKYNSEVMGELSVLLPGRVLEMYTRQSFWDSSVQAGPWKKYPLAAARYNEQLNCPWSDGQFIFRDWDEWRYWQDSQWWDCKKYGAESFNLDHLYFNGDREIFKFVYGLGSIEPPPPEEDVWKFRVIRETLNYRSEPIVATSTWRGKFDHNDVIDAVRTVNPVLGDFWLEFNKDGETYYSALIYKGRQYCTQI
jgi:GH25 family lysozyme M1 (1,4-beta-N-acetylmuramidase)